MFDLLIILECNLYLYLEFIYMSTLLLFIGFGAQELIFIVLIILLLFGGKKIPELMKGLGKGVRSFRDGMNDIESLSKENPEKKASEKE